MGLKETLTLTANNGVGAILNSAEVQELVTRLAAADALAIVLEKFRRERIANKVIDRMYNEADEALRQYEETR